MTIDILMAGYPDGGWVQDPPNSERWVGVLGEVLVDVQHIDPDWNPKATDTLVWESNGYISSMDVDVSALGRSIEEVLRVMEKKISGIKAV